MEIKTKITNGTYLNSKLLHSKRNDKQNEDSYLGATSRDDTYVSVRLGTRAVFAADDAPESPQQRKERGAGALGRPLVVSLPCPAIPQVQQQQDSR